jgi:hypothetical protein
MRLVAARGAYYTGQPPLQPLLFIATLLKQTAVVDH